MWLFGRKRKKKESAPVQGFGEQTESGSLDLEEKTFREEQKEADIPEEESPAELHAGTAETVPEEEADTQKEPDSPQETEGEETPQRPLEPPQVEMAQAEEASEEHAEEEAVADPETVSETAVPDQKNVSLYEWGRKKKKKKKKKKKAVCKKTVRLGQGERSVVLGEGMPKICVPVTGRTLEEIVDQASNAASAFPDFVEWRVDYFEEIHPLEAGPSSGELPVNTVSSVFPAVDRALKKMADVLNGLPILFTVRTATEGGQIALYPEDYIGLLLHAAERPEVSAIDVEELRADSDMEILTREIQARHKPVIGSAHFFGKMPKKTEQIELMDRISRTGADVLKLAAMPSDSRGVLKMMEMAEEENRMTDKPVIAIAMGKIGMVSRVSGALTGSCVSFGTVDAESAPGQIPVSTLRTILEALQG